MVLSVFRSVCDAAKGVHNFEKTDVRDAVELVHGLLSVWLGFAGRYCCCLIGASGEEKWSCSH